MGTKKCSKCGKEKSYDNFYIQHKEMNQYGASDPRSYRHNCKECCSSSAKKQREVVEILRIMIKLITNNTT